MKTFQQFIDESGIPTSTQLVESTMHKPIVTQSDFDDLKKWVENLEFKGKTPKGMKTEKDALVKISKSIANVELFGLNDNLLNILNLYVEKLDVEKVNLKFGTQYSDQPSVIKGNYATYYKEDARTYERFVEAVANIEKLLSTLKGYHKKSIIKLKVKFVKSSVIKSIAKYNESSDTILVNLKKVWGEGDGYGSLSYIIVHELGHRYLKHNPINYNWGTDIDSDYWITTKYSKVDSFSGEEKFAELFAMNHWKSKYKQYSRLMKEFESTIK